MKNPTNEVNTHEQKRREMTIVMQLNEEHCIEEIGPLYGVQSMAKKSDMDVKLVLVPHGQEIMRATEEVDYSTDNYSNEHIPSIMEEAFVDEKARKIHEIIERDTVLTEAENKLAEYDRKRQATIDGLINPSEFEVPETSPEDDFWDEPDTDSNVLPFENVQTVSDKMLTARQAAVLIFKNDSKEAMQIVYSKKMRRKLGAYSRGKGCKVFYPESKVLAYIAKQPKCSKGFAMYLPEHSAVRRK